MSTATIDFDSYVRARRPALLRTAMAITHDADSAEDLLQAALAKVYVSWAKVREQAALDGYVRRVMINTHATWWRRTWRHRETTVATMPDISSWAGSREAELARYATDASAVVAQRDELWPLLMTLPPKQRAIVVLRYLEDRSEAETAEILGVSTGTVKSQASRGVATLRRRLLDRAEVADVQCA